MPMPPMKHILDDRFGAPDAGNTTKTIDLAVGTLNPDPYANNNAVKAGSIISTIVIQLEFGLYTGVADNAQFDYLDWYVWFNVAGSQTVPAPDNVGNSDLKNQVFHQDGAILMSSTASATTPARGSWAKWNLVIKVPKWARQLNKDDKIQLNYKFQSTAATHFGKLKAIYVEYFP